MAPDVFFAIPGDVDTPTGGYAYDRRVLALLPQHGVAARHLALPGSFPWASVSDLAETQSILQNTPDGAVLLIDGLALGAMTDLVLTSVFRPIVALVHHPLAMETGLSDRQRRALASSERAALARARHVIATSPETGRLLVSDFGVPPDQLTVALPGCDPAPRATGSHEAAPVLLAVGAVSPRKGYDVLIGALATLRDRPWRLRILGATDRDQAEMTRLANLLETHGLTDRVRFEGSLSGQALENAYATADMFVHAAHYEGYGMVLAEAMARGLPMVVSTGGAAGETVPDGAALKIPPGDAQALAAAISTVLDDPQRRKTLGEAAWRAGQVLPRWDDTAATIAGVLKRIGA